MINIKRYGTLCLSAILAAAFVLTPAVKIFAEEGDTAADRETQRQTCYAEPTDSNGLTNWPQGPAVYADSAIVMDMNSGAILYGKQIDKQHYPASITKLLTTLVALDHAKLTDKVEFSQDSISFLQYGDAHIGMRAGEELTLEDSLYAVLLASANEVSYAVAESVGKQMGGDYNTFIEAMNEESDALGCTGSHWTNANGLHDEQHYTTAHDMALIGAAVYQKEAFRTIAQSLTHQIPPTNLVNEVRTVNQKHKMLWPQNANYYEYCKGGKTGYTGQARTTLVTMADNGELQLVAVVLYDFGSDAYTDTRAIFDYGFNNFSKVMLKDQEKADGVRSYKDEENAYVVLPPNVKFSDLKAEVKAKDGSVNEGTVTYTYEGQIVGKADVTLDNKKSVEKPTITKGTEKTGTTTDRKEKESRPVVLIAVVAVVLVLVTGAVAWIKYKQAKSRRHRRKRHRRKTSQKDIAEKEKTLTSRQNLFIIILYGRLQVKAMTERVGFI